MSSSPPPPPATSSPNGQEAGSVGSIITGDEAATVHLEKKKAIKKVKSLILLLANLATTITYQAGLDPPGGFWPEDGEGHRAGDAILLSKDPARYKYRFPNGRPGPNLAQALFGPALSCRALLGRRASRAVPNRAVVPNPRPRHGPMETWSCRVVPKARRASQVRRAATACRR